MTRQPAFTRQAASASNPRGYDLEGLPPTGKLFSAQDVAFMHADACNLPPAEKVILYMLRLCLPSVLHTGCRCLPC